MKEKMGRLNNSNINTVELRLSGLIRTEGGLDDENSGESEMILFFLEEKATSVLHINFLLVLTRRVGP